MRAEFELRSLGAVVLVFVFFAGPVALAEDPFTIQPGDTVAGHLLSADIWHCIHIDLPAHAALKAKLRRDSDEDFAVRLEMKGPNAAPYNVEPWLRTKSDGRKAELRGFEVPESGTWRLVPRTGDFRAGRYTLSTRVKYRKKFKALGAITTEAQEVSFSFTAPAGATAKVKLKGREGLRPRVLEILGPNGLRIALPEAAVSGKKVKLRDVDLPYTGDYTLLVAGREGTVGTARAKIKVRAPRTEQVVREYDGPTNCGEDGGGPGPDPDQFTISTGLVSPSDQTISVGTIEVRALTMSLFATQSTTVRTFRLRSYGLDEDVRAVRLYWDNDRFYTEDDTGGQIAGGLVTFVNGRLDLDVDIALTPYAPRYLHVVLDLEPDLPVDREVGVRIPSGGVDISAGLWNPASRPPHDPGPIRIIVPQVTYGWQDMSQIAGDGGPAGEGHLMVRADRKLIVFPANETPFRNYYELNLDFLGAGWRLVSADGGLPPKRWGACGVYDPDDERLVMFGGQNGTGSGSYLADVWQLDLTKSPPEWADITPGSGGAPSARMFASAVLDTRRRRMVVFGGHDGNSATQVDVWSWDLANDRWQGPLEVEGSIPWGGQGLTGHVAVYDNVHDRMVVTGGSPVAAKQDEFTTMSQRSYFLEFADVPDKSTWRNLWQQAGEAPTGRMQAAAIFDGARMLVHGGARRRLASGGLTDFESETWVLDVTSTLAKKWERIHFTENDVPTARAGHVAVWDPEDRVVVFYGGRDADGDLEESWFLREEDE